MSIHVNTCEPAEQPPSVSPYLKGGAGPGLLAPRAVDGGPHTALVAPGQLRSGWLAALA